MAAKKKTTKPQRLHPRDPMTAEQLADLEKMFFSMFRENYKKALSSGALGEDDLKEGSQWAGIVVLALTGENWVDRGGPDIKAMIKNLRNFI